MSEANTDFTDRDSEGDVTAVAADPSDDRLLTTRLPPITPPPIRPPSVPPSSATEASFSPASGSFRREVSIPPQARTSWWNALVAATTAPPASVVQTPTDERIVRRRIGATCAGMAVGFVILALALGLRGAEPAYSAPVAGALVVARAIVALGFLAFGYALLRMAERIFLGRPENTRDSSRFH